LGHVNVNALGYTERMRWAGARRETCWKEGWGEGQHSGTHRIILMDIYNESRFKIYVAKGDTARKLRLMGRLGWFSGTE